MSKLEAILVAAKVPAGAVRAVVSACRLVNESRQGTIYQDAVGGRTTLAESFREQYGVSAAEWLDNLLTKK